MVSRVSSGRTRAEANPLIIDMPQEVVGASFSQDFLAAVAGDGFGGFVPEGDAPVVIDVINPVVEIVQDFLIKPGIEFPHVSPSRPGPWRTGIPLVIGPVR